MESAAKRTQTVLRCGRRRRLQLVADEIADRAAGTANVEFKRWIPGRPAIDTRAGWPSKVKDVRSAVNANGPPVMISS